MGRPGIMLYFDILEPIKVLPDAEKGQLLVAMLEYGKEGVLPQFDGMLALAWGFVKPKLDKDSEEYNRTILKRQYATYCRDRKKKGEPEATFEEWLMTIGDQNHHMISHDITWYPTTTTSTTTSTTTKTTTSTAAAATTSTSNPEIAATAAETKVNVIGGLLGQGALVMSDQQMEDLLDRMGLDAFDYYSKKLSTFIIKNNAQVKNHYETILKWWGEDGHLRSPGR